MSDLFSRLVLNKRENGDTTMPSGMRADISVWGFNAALIKLVRETGFARASLEAVWEMDAADTFLDHLETEFAVAGDKATFLFGVTALLAAAENGELGLDVETELKARISDLV